MLSNRWKISATLILLVLLSIPGFAAPGQESLNQPTAGAIRVIVGLADPPLAQYQGTINNLAATTTSIGGVKISGVAQRSFSHLPDGDETIASSDWSPDLPPSAQFPPAILAGDDEPLCFLS